MTDLKQETDRLLALAPRMPRYSLSVGGQLVWIADDMAAHIRALQAEIDRLTERDQRLMSKLGAFKGSGDPAIDAVLGTDDAEWRPWVESLPDTHWSRYDLSALRIGWHYGREKLTAECEALRVDAERLDWIEENAIFIALDGRKWSHCQMGVARGNISAAMNRERPNG